MKKKEYQTAVSWDEEVLVIDINGRASAENAAAITQDVFAIVAAHQPKRILIDSRNLQGRLGVADTYFHVRNYPRTDSFFHKTAVLDREENKSYYSFHETAAVNTGLVLQYFTDYAAAMLWLRQ